MSNNFMCHCDILSMVEIDSAAGNYRFQKVMKLQVAIQKLWQQEIMRNYFQNEQRGSMHFM